MASSSSTPTQFTADVIDYKPLALLAVAGFVTSLLYAVLLVFLALWALFKHVPFFMPLWWLLLPIGGATLSGAGLWQIANSEGTRAGTKLAKWGLWISVVLSLCYLTYHTAARTAIEKQANNFMLERGPDSGFLVRLQGTDAELRTAFLYTLASFDRTNAHPENEEEMKNRYDKPSQQFPKGRLTPFLNSSLIRLIRQAAPGTVQFEPLSVKSLEYENGAYKIERKYRITTEEGVFEVPFTITSMEPEGEGDKRKWKVEWRYQTELEPVSRTPTGEKRVGLRTKSFDFLADPLRGGWTTTLRLRLDLDFFLGTQPPRDRAAWQASLRALSSGTPLIAAGGGTALSTIVRNPDPKAATALLKGFFPAKSGKEFKGVGDAAKVFSTAKLQFPDAKLLTQIKDAVAKALDVDMLPKLVLKMQPDPFAPCEVKNGQVYVSHDFEFMVPLPAGAGPPGVILTGKFVVVAPADLDPAAADADQQWQVLTPVELLRILPMPSKQGPGG